MSKEIQVQLFNPEKDSPELLNALRNLEKKYFPKHESMATELERELKKRNTFLLYILDISGALSAYLMLTVQGLAATISKLAVREDVRRHGFASALMEEALERARARRAQCVRLHVDPERKGAFALYEKHGFKVESLQEGYYAPHRHAYRMFRDLDT